MKKLSKKLKLNKETVASLNNDEMNNIKGGDLPWTFTQLNTHMCGTESGKCDFPTNNDDSRCICD